ncbi:MAG: protoglobin domain-containing protein [Candidatus Thiodiazotropha sp.]
MDDTQINKLMEYAKRFTGLTPEREAALIQAAPTIEPVLSPITEDFYATLQQIEQTAPFLEGRLEQLKTTHRSWLAGLFHGPYDSTFTRSMYRVGAVHVQVGLPVEFMSGGICLITHQLIQRVTGLYANAPDQVGHLLSAINAVTGFALLIMQQSYQSASLAVELDRFLKVTGMSRTLFDNLASACHD